jgi:hypothetical protein
VKIWFLIGVLASLAVACAKPDPVEAAFQKCTKNINDNIRSLEHQPDAVRGVANGISGLGLKACDLIKTVCQNKESDVCKVTLEQYR